MKIISWINVLTFLIVLIFSDSTIRSQGVIEKSNDKVVISGIPYYIHLVKKGETAYSISRTYGITVEELIKENPPALYGVNVGQSLRIPIKKVSETLLPESLNTSITRDESKFIYHSLNPGETVYSLSKSYGVSENEIVLSNPGIDITKMSVGTEIAVPRRDFMTVREKFDDQEEDFFYHKVIIGESLSSIAEKYGLTLRELRRANRDLRFPQIDDFLKVPGLRPFESAKEQATPDTVNLFAEEPAYKRNRPEAYTEIKNLKGSLNAAVLLPFYLKENSIRIEIDSSQSIGGKKIYKKIVKPEDWIYRRSFDFVEMYEGILMAADTLSSLGLDINLFTYDVKDDTMEVSRLIQSGQLSQMDLIIGPVYSNNLTAVASYAKEFGIPVVSPVPLINNSALTLNPTLFMTNSSIEIAQRALSRKISDYFDQNIILIHTDTAGSDQDIKRFKNMIFSDLSYKIPYEEIRFKEFPFYSRSMFDNDSINRLSHALSGQLKNIILIASEDPSVISELIGEIHGLSKKFNVEVFGYPSMIEIENLDPKYFFDLDIMVYSPSWIDYTRDDVKYFNSKFRSKFLTQPLEMSFAWQGYDIAYYFLSGLALFGKEFIDHPDIHYPDLLQTEYYFERNESSNGFENMKLFLIRYSKDYEVKLVEETNITQDN